MIETWMVWTLAVTLVISAQMIMGAIFYGFKYHANTVEATNVDYDIATKFTIAVMDKYDAKDNIFDTKDMYLELYEDILADLDDIDICGAVEKRDILIDRLRLEREAEETSEKDQKTQQ